MDYSAISHLHKVIFIFWLQVSTPVAKVNIVPGLTAKLLVMSQIMFVGLAS